MIILQYVISLLIAVIGAAAAVIFRWNYLDRKKLKYGDLILQQKKPMVFFLVCYVFIALFGVFVFNKKSVPPPLVIEFVIFWGTVLLCAVIDYKIKKIPNKLIIFLIIVRGLGFFCECIDQKQILIENIKTSVVGFIVGGVIMLACMLLSKGGVGGGDVKLIAAIGLYYGFLGVLSILMMTLMTAAIVSIVMLVSKKAKMKSTLPMAPFIFLGLSVHNILM